MEFAGKAVTSSSCLRILHIEFTSSSREVGEAFMKLLADSELSSLHSLTIARERDWFKEGRNGCMESLITLIERQTELELLNMRGEFQDYNFT